MRARPAPVIVVGALVVAIAVPACSGSSQSTAGPSASGPTSSAAATTTIPTTTAQPATITTATTDVSDAIACCERFSDAASGISSVVPDGWERVGPTAFTGNGAELGFWSYPNLSQELAVAAWSRLLAASPVVLDPYRTEQFNWMVHTGTTVGGGFEWFAVAEGEGGLHAVALRSDVDDPGVYDEVLRPALDMFAFEEPQRDPESARLAAAGRSLFDYDADRPLGIEAVGSVEFGDVTLQQITYASPAAGDVPADLWIPGGGGSFPALILMHGLPSDRSEVSDEARAYAAAGVLVIAIDAPHARPEHTAHEPVTGTEQDRVEQIQLIQDLRRAVDLLQARPDVEPARVGYVGISYGGAMGGLLAGVEPRLAAAVLVVGDGGLVSHATGLDDPPPGGAADGEALRTWIDLMWPIEPIHYVADAEMPLLFQSALLDEAVPFDDAIRYQRAAGGDAEVLWYDGGHSLPAEASLDRAVWLATYLGFDPTRFVP